MKIIYAGLPKTGTKSMREAFEILGYKNVHDYFEQLTYDGNIWEKHCNGSASKEDYINVYKNVDATTDMPLCFMWREVLDAFPQAKVIVTIRENAESWLRSYLNQLVEINNQIPQLKYQEISRYLFSTRMTPWMDKLIRYRRIYIKLLIGCSTYINGSGFDKEKSLRVYNSHLNSLKMSVPENQLLIFNVKDGWEPLCHFLEKEIPNCPFPSRNVNGSVAKSVVDGSMAYDAGYSNKIHREMKMVNSFLLVVLLGLLMFIMYVIDIRQLF